MSHGSQVGLFVMGALGWLRDHGLVGGGVADRITAKGTAAFDQLEREGFRPTADEVRGFLGALKRRFGVTSTPREDDMLVTLISKWDRMKAMVCTPPKP